MKIREIKGLRFPDPYIIKFFYKENLNELNGNVIELGCNSGNNLSLFYSYNFNVCGVDISKEAIQNAKFNFEKLFKNNNKFLFIQEDMRNIENIKKILDKNFDKFNVLLIPNVINYLRKNEFETILNKLHDLLEKKGKFFLRFRSPRDMRVAMGKKIGEDEYFMEDNLTGEGNTILSVYEESEMINLLNKYFKLYNVKIFHLYEENYHKDRKILNADIVIWGDYEL